MSGISVIIPTLNEENYIGKLLDCLVKQTYKDFEVIVVDAVSTDKTLVMVNQYSRKLKMRIVKTGKKLVAHQRNLGARNAKFESLLFLDADTTFPVDFLNKSIREMKKNESNIAVPRYVPDIRKWYYGLFFSCINIVSWCTQKIRPLGIGSCLFSSKQLHSCCPFDETLAWADDLEYVKVNSKNSKFMRLSTYVQVSVRRFEKEGTKNTMKRWLLAYYCMLIGKTARTNEIAYFTNENL